MDKQKYLCYNLQECTHSAAFKHRGTMSASIPYKEEKLNA